MRHAAPFLGGLAPVGEGGAVLMAHRAAIQDRLAQAGGEFAEPGPDSMALRSSGVRLWTFMTRADPGLGAPWACNRARLTVFWDDCAGLASPVVSDPAC